jgi:hypothetical protein
MTDALNHKNKNAAAAASHLPNATRARARPQRGLNLKPRVLKAQPTSRLGAASGWLVSLHLCTQSRDTSPRDLLADNNNKD